MIRIIAMSINNYILRDNLLLYIERIVRVYSLNIPKQCSSNCYDCIFSSLLQYNNFDFEAYNYKYFYTNYYDSESIDPIYRIRRSVTREYTIAILNRFYNINVVFHKRDHAENIENLFGSWLPEKPIGIVIDPYYCSWTNFYQKRHYLHALLIVDIDFVNQKYICFDTYHNTIGFVKVDWNIIHKYYTEYFMMNFENAMAPKKRVLFDHIDEIIINFQNNSEVKKMELLNYFTTNDREMLFPRNLETSVPLLNLKWIAEDKKYFTAYLTYAEGKSKRSLFSDVYPLLFVSEQKFHLLKSLLTKYAITGSLNHNSLEALISEIIATDVKIIEQMGTYKSFV